MLSWSVLCLVSTRQIDASIWHNRDSRRSVDHDLVSAHPLSASRHPKGIAMERSFTAEVEQLRLAKGQTFTGEGILAVTKADGDNRTRAEAAPWLPPTAR